MTPENPKGMNGFQFPAAIFKGPDFLIQAFRHVIHGDGQFSQLFRIRNRHSGAQVSLGKFRRTFFHFFHGPG